MPIYSFIPKNYIYHNGYAIVLIENIIQCMCEKLIVYFIMIFIMPFKWFYVGLTITLITNEYNTI